jgi:hypothetical protein
MSAYQHNPVVLRDRNEPLLREFSGGFFGGQRFQKSRVKPHAIAWLTIESLCLRSITKVITRKLLQGLGHIADRWQSIRPSDARRRMTSDSVRPLFGDACAINDLFEGVSPSVIRLSITPTSRTNYQFGLVLSLIALTPRGPQAVRLSYPPAFS